VSSRELTDTKASRSQCSLFFNVNGWRLGRGVAIVVILRWMFPFLEVRTVRYTIIGLVMQNLERMIFISAATLSYIIILVVGRIVNTPSMADIFTLVFYVEMVLSEGEEPVMQNVSHRVTLLELTAFLLHL
jgi:hypothetical protein